MFGTAAILVAPSSPLLSSGYVPGNTLAAQTFNWYLYHLTLEINNVLLSAGVAQSTGNDSQLLTSIFFLIPKYSIQNASYSTSQTPAALTANQFWTVTAPGNTTQNISAGAVASGMLLGIQNIGSGSCTVQGSFYAGGAGGSAIVGSAIVLTQFQWVGLRFNGSGWTWIDGQFPLLTSIDNVIPGYSLGRLIHIPLGNTINRTVLNGAAAPAQSSWSSAYQTASLYGVPMGAKAVRARVQVALLSSGAGTGVIEVCFSDNILNVPTTQTGHPNIRFSITQTAITQSFNSCSEMDIPLNALGQFYIYSLTLTNGSSYTIYVTIVGYYLGD